MTNVRFSVGRIIQTHYQIKHFKFAYFLFQCPDPIVVWFMLTRCQYTSSCLTSQSALDVITHRNQCKINFSMASNIYGTNVSHTRATVTALLEILYVSLLGFIYYRYASLCEGCPTKRVIEFECAMRK